MKQEELNFNLIKKESDKINNILNDSMLNQKEMEIMLYFIAARIKLKLKYEEMNGIWLALEQMQLREEKKNRRSCGCKFEDGYLVVRCQNCKEKEFSNLKDILTEKIIDYFTNHIDKNNLESRLLQTEIELLVKAINATK